MKYKLDLYYYEECPYCQKVLKTIDKLNLKINLLNTRTDEKNREFHIKKTGKTQVPCLYIDGQPMFESSDIVNWINENQSEIEKK